MIIESTTQERSGEAAQWQATLACGVLKILIAAAAVALPLLEGRPFAASVGWMLAVGGVAELALGWSAHRSALGKVVLGSGLLTVLTGLLFLTSGWTGLFPMTTVLIIWLLLRGLISLDVGYQSQDSEVNWFWLEFRGLTDLGLGLLLLLGVPIAMIPIVLFGASRDLITVFAASLAISFLVAGIGLVAIAFAQRRLAPS